MKTNDLPSRLIRENLSPQELDTRVSELLRVQTTLTPAKPGGVPRALAERVVELELRISKGDDWEVWAFELMDRLDICEKDALKDPFDSDEAQIRLGAIIEEAMRQVAVARADPLVMDAAKASVLGIADRLEEEARRYGIMRSLSATRTLRWLMELANVLREVCGSSADAEEETSAV